MALAPPPVYRSENKFPQKFVENIKIFVNKSDNVPRFSFATVALAIEQMRAIDGSELGIKDCLKIIFGKEDKEKFKNVEKRVANATQNDKQNFHHPGTVYHLREKSDFDETLTIVKTEGQYFSKSLCISDGMLWNHMPEQYEDAFARVKFEKFEENGVTSSFVIPGLTLLWEILLGLFHFLHSNDSMISVVKYK